jgi:hypothetical protein
MPRYIYYIINILCCLNIQAQQTSDAIINAQSIKQLRKGYLLVRLESKENKINFLEQQMKHKDCDEKCKTKKEEELKDIRQTRDSFNIEFIKALKSNFRFSRVFFYYDKDHQKLADAQYKGNLFLDEHLNYTTINSINIDSMLILKKGLTPNSENTGWLFQTKEGHTLTKGFPYISENKFKTLLNEISSSDHLQRNCEYIANTLNEKLYKYYLKTEKKRKKIEEEVEELENEK